MFYLKLRCLETGRVEKVFGNFETFEAAADREDKLGIDYGRFEVEILEISENKTGEEE